MPELDLNKTYCAILNAARNKRFISYADLAKANNAKWKKVRRTLFPHLGELMKISTERNWPLLSSIVVIKKNIENGELHGSARDGFINAARKNGHDIGDPSAFIKEQQQAVFKWAKDAPDVLSDSQQETENELPQIVPLFGPLLDALRFLGGRGKPNEVIEQMVDILKISDDDLRVTTKSGQRKFGNNIHWAHCFLFKAGLIGNKERGIWNLTPEGRETYLDSVTAYNLYKQLLSEVRNTIPDNIDEVDPPPEEADNLFENEDRRFWFVGSIWGASGDQMERFRREGVWENGYKTDKYAERVERMQSGDRIAIKASFTKKYNVPFENQGKSVACMRIKAIGTITEATKDGVSVKVDWELLKEPKEWYFYIYFVTIIEADVSQELARRLILFTFGDHSQDYEYFLRVPYWKELYRPNRVTQMEPGFEIEEEDSDFEEDEITPYTISDIIDDGCFLSQENLSLAYKSLEEKKNLILQGPPGTGKTWLAKRLGYVLIGTKNRTIVRKRMRSIQFHPSLSYEDFVRGWRPDGEGGLSLIDGVFLESIEAARAMPDRPFIVIIEEINRGNPAQIFGEMLTLMEKDKRNEEEAIKLAYHRQGEHPIFIPKNLYLIGTMNIADRSLALVDYALRRRFAFTNLEPALNESWVEWCIKKAEIDRTVLLDIQKKMNNLNDEIAKDRLLGSQFRIGHSYVTPDDAINDPKAWFRRIVETEITPLLEEYWFENPDKVNDIKTRLLQGFEQDA